MQVLNTDADSKFNTGMKMIGVYMYAAQFQYDWFYSDAHGVGKLIHQYFAYWSAYKK
jgi:hypothetical protein